MKLIRRLSPPFHHCLVYLAFILFLSVVINGVTRSAKTSADDKPMELGLTVQMLDQMSALPGGLAALPARLPNESAQPAAVELGKLLFFDSRLSLDRSMSCATCHDPTKGFTDGQALATGFAGKALKRHSPTLLNSAFNTRQFWDGRSASLEDQALGPIKNPDEMNMGNDEMVIERLNRVPQYRELFQHAYQQAPTMQGIAKALAAFERTLITPDAPFDHYMKGDKAALTAAEKRGLLWFISKASCSQCHNGVNLTDNEFYNLGHNATNDQGRFAITKAEKDKAAFKTPSLRNVALTAPYMHDGSLQTLEEVVDYYNQGGGNNPHKSNLIMQLFLTDQEKADLVAFLKTLTGSQPPISKPEIPHDQQ
ncbi:MAG: c-type cytochrome [Acidobacteria bacterium]|nr:c-type cytochrome [Acidobacteriota bacterium]